MPGRPIHSSGRWASSNERRYRRRASAYAARSSGVGSSISAMRQNAPRAASEGELRIGVGTIEERETLEKRQPLNKRKPREKRNRLRNGSRRLSVSRWLSVSRRSSSSCAILRYDNACRERPDGDRRPDQRENSRRLRGP